MYINGDEENKAIQAILDFADQEHSPKIRVRYMPPRKGGSKTAYRVYLSNRFVASIIVAKGYVYPVGRLPENDYTYVLMPNDGSAPIIDSHKLSAQFKLIQRFGK